MSLVTPTFTGVENVKERHTRWLDWFKGFISGALGATTALLGLFGVIARMV